MNIRGLKYLVALSEYRHFGKAAKACFVSQPALSMQIKKFEKYLGVQLIERTNKCVWLTEVGAIIAQRASHILHELEEMRGVAKLLKDPFNNELKLGIIPTLAPCVLPTVIPTLAKLFPNLKIYLSEENAACLMEKLRDGMLDAVLLSPPIAEPGLIIKSLYEEEFLLAVPKNHTFSKRKQINQAELTNTTMLLFEDVHFMNEPDTIFNRMIQASEIKSFRATSLETLRHMVATRVGITLMPKLGCKLYSGVKYIPFSNPKPARVVGIIWRESTAKQLLLEEIAGCIKKTMIHAILHQLY